MPESKIIYLIDPLIGGHHLSIIQEYAICLLREGHKVIVICQGHDRVRDYVNDHCREFSTAFKSFPFSRWVLVFQGGTLFGLQRFLVSGVNLVTDTLKLILAIFQILVGIIQTIFFRTNNYIFFEWANKYLERVPSSRIESLMDRCQTLVHWAYASYLVKKISHKTGASPDLVFFCWLDSYICTSPWVKRIAEMLFTYKWSGLLFHPADEAFPLYQSHTMIGSKNLETICLLNEYVENDFFNYVQKDRVIFFPDIISEDPPDVEFKIAQDIKAKAGQRVIIGVIGSLDRRKGVITLLQAAALSTNRPWYFVFAGKPAISTFNFREWLLIQHAQKTMTENCYFSLGEIPGEAQFNALINTCDIVFAGYLGFKNSSNLLTKAAFFNKPVIVSKGYCMERRVKKYDTGIAIREGNVSDCVQAIEELTVWKEMEENRENNALLFYQDHSHEKLALAWRKLLKSDRIEFSNIESVN